MSLKPPTANLAQKIEVLDYHKDQLSKNPKYKQHDTIIHFKTQREFVISKQSLSRWLASEGSLRESLHNHFFSDNVKRMNKLETDSQVYKCLELSYFQKLYKRMFVVDSVIKEADIINELAEEYSYFHEFMLGNANTPAFSYIKDFIRKSITSKYEIESNFINYHSIRKRKLESSSRSAANERIRFQKICKDYKPSQVYQYGEFRIDPNQLNHLMHSDQEVKSVSALCDLITVGMALNITATDCPHPMIISNAAIDKRSPNYQYSSIGLATFQNFNRFVLKWDQSLNNRILLIVDNSYAHYINDSNLKNIKMVFLNEKTELLKHSKDALNFGLMSLFKMCIKISLWEESYFKYITIEDIWIDAIGVIKHISASWDKLIKLFSEDFIYKNFLQLCFTKSYFSIPFDAIVVKSKTSLNDGIYYLRPMKRSLRSIIFKFSNLGLIDDDFKPDIKGLVTPQNEIVRNEIYDNETIAELVKRGLINDSKLTNQITDKDRELKIRKTLVNEFKPFMDNITEFDKTNLSYGTIVKFYDFFRSYQNDFSSKEDSVRAPKTSPKRKQNGAGHDVKQDKRKKSKASYKPIEKNNMKGAKSAEYVVDSDGSDDEMFDATTGSIITDTITEAATRTESDKPIEKFNHDGDKAENKPQSQEDHSDSSSSDSDDDASEKSNFINSYQNVTERLSEKYMSTPDVESNDDSSSLDSDSELDSGSVDDLKLNISAEKHLKEIVDAATNDSLKVSNDSSIPESSSSSTSSLKENTSIQIQKVKDSISSAKSKMALKSTSSNNSSELMLKESTPKATHSAEVFTTPKLHMSDISGSDASPKTRLNILESSKRKINKINKSDISYILESTNSDRKSMKKRKKITLTPKITFTSSRDLSEEPSIRYPEKILNSTEESANDSVESTSNWFGSESEEKNSVDEIKDIDSADMGDTDYDD